MRQKISANRLEQPSYGLAIGAVIVLGAAGLVTWWFNGNHANETDAKQRLIELGALVAMDADGRHVGTVTLSTLNDLAKVREAMQLAAVMRKIKALDLNRTSIDGSDLRTIGTMTTLTSLSLKSTKIDDQGLANLAGLRRLESLHLADTAVSDAALGHLAPLKAIKVLDLSGTRVSSDISPVASLPQLEWLVLGQLTLSDAALDVLASAPSLKRLTLRGSEYNEAAVEALRSKRPGLSIDEST
jgi:Leucine-rich repeat (LRR) protein